MIDIKALTELEEQGLNEEGHVLGLGKNVMLEIIRLAKIALEAKKILKNVNCECCIGNPMCSGHSKDCIKAKELLASYPKETK